LPAENEVLEKEKKKPWHRRCYVSGAIFIYQHPKGALDA
jgi:hypothetical protein